MSFFDRWTNHVLALFRIVVGALFACHGLSSLFGVFPQQGMHTAAFASWPGWWAAAIQLVGGLLVALGLGTRYAALLCSGSMAYAYFTVHLPKGFAPILNGGEPSAMFAWAFVLLAFTGPGVWALETLFTRGRATVAASSRVRGPEMAPSTD